MREVIERGDIFFFYRPRAFVEHVRGLSDVQRLYIILSPKCGPHRLIALGQPQLPEKSPDDAAWGIVMQVAENQEVVRNALEAGTAAGKLSGHGGVEAGPARPAGEGRYEISTKNGESTLAYALELPEALGPVQAQLRIQRKGGFRVESKTPLLAYPPGFLDPQERRPFPVDALEKLGEPNWHKMSKPDLLNHRGIPILFHSVEEQPLEEITRRVDPEKTTWEDADLFRELGETRRHGDTRPLVSGEWN